MIVADARNSWQVHSAAADSLLLAIAADDLGSEVEAKDCTNHTEVAEEEGDVKGPLTLSVQQQLYDHLIYLVHHSRVVEKYNPSWTTNSHQ